jgi:hypothetical protein
MSKKPVILTTHHRHKPSEFAHKVFEYIKQMYNYPVFKLRS